MSVQLGRNTLQDLLMQKTNNPMAEAEIPRLLADIISSGGKVIVKDELSGQETLLDFVDGKFVLKNK